MSREGLLCVQNSSPPGRILIFHHRLDGYEKSGSAYILSFSCLDPTSRGIHTYTTRLFTMKRLQRMQSNTPLSNKEAAAREQRYVEMFLSTAVHVCALHGSSRAALAASAVHRIGSAV